MTTSLPLHVVDAAPSSRWERFRDLFPALDRVVWLDTATVAPGPLPVVHAVRAAEDEWLDGSLSWRRWEDDAEETRRLFGRLVGAPARCIALLPSASQGVATVAASLRAGRVVVGEREFRSNLFPWLALRDRGVEVVEVPARNGVVTTDAIVARIDRRTTLVAVSEVQSSTGVRVDLEAIGRRCRAVGARLFVNLTQSLGALRFDAEAVGADYAVAHGYKWLLAPRGAAWLYVAPHRLGEVPPLVPSWKSPADPHATYYGGPVDISPEGRGLDGSLAWLSWVGARAALEMLPAAEAEAREERCLRLAAGFRRGAQRRGITLVPQDAPSHVAGALVDRPDALRRRLSERRVVAAVRGGTLRLGFHAFNDEGDVAAALDAFA